MNSTVANAPKLAKLLYTNKVFNNILSIFQFDYMYKAPPESEALFATKSVFSIFKLKILFINMAPPFNAEF